MSTNKKNFMYLLVLIVFIGMLLYFITPNAYASSAKVTERNGFYYDEDGIELIVVGKQRTIYGNSTYSSVESGEWQILGDKNALEIVDKRYTSCIVKAVSPGIATVNATISSKYLVQVPGYNMLGSYIPGYSYYNYGTDTVNKKLHVVNPIKKINLPSKINMTIGSTKSLSKYVKPNNEYSIAASGVVYKSSNPNVLSVSKTGKITAKTSGKVTITAKTTNLKKNISSKCSVTVKAPAVKTIKLNKKSVKLAVGETLKLKATITPSKANKSIKWSSSNKKVATINNGKLKAVKKGKTKITAKAKNGKKAICNVTINPAPKKVSIKLSAKEFIVNKEYSAQAVFNKGAYITKGNLSWSSSNSKVIKVTKNGNNAKLKMQSVGKATIKVKLFNGKTASKTISVSYPKTTKITLNKTSLTVKVGDVYNLIATQYPSNANNKITFSSSSPNIVIVDNKGKIRAVDTGKAVITAKVGSVIAKCSITVQYKPRFIIDLGIGYCIDKDYNLLTWGAGDSNSKYRKLINDSNSYTPKFSMSGVKQIASAAYDYFIIKTNNDLYVGGPNKDGELGVGSKKEVLKMTKVLSNVKSVDTTGHITVVVTQNGDLYTCGSDRTLGDGESSRSSFKKIMSNVKKAEVSYNSTMAVITNSGDLYVCGGNNDGYLIDGKASTINKLTKIMSDVVDVSLGFNFSGAVKTNGDLYMWGKNYYGQLCKGDTIDCKTPIKVMGNVKSVKLGLYNTCILANNGDLFTCGENYYGQLGNGTDKSCSSPVCIMKNVDKVVNSGFRCGALTKNGEIYTWGHNDSGCLGIGTNTNTNLPTKVIV